MTVDPKFINPGVVLDIHQQKEVLHLMLEDYERVIYYLIRKLGKDPEEINVIMAQGDVRHDFKIKRPNELPHPMATPHVYAIEYQERI